MVNPVFKTTETYITYNESSIVRFFVKATNKVEAIKKVREAGYRVEATRNETDYDCTGQWYCGGAHPRGVKWCSAHRCYVVSVYWSLDV